MLYWCYFIKLVLFLGGPSPFLSEGKIDIFDRNLKRCLNHSAMEKHLEIENNNVNFWLLLLCHPQIWWVQTNNSGEWWRVYMWGRTFLVILQCWSASCHPSSSDHAVHQLLPHNKPHKKLLNTFFSRHFSMRNIFRLDVWNFLGKHYVQSLIWSQVKMLCEKKLSIKAIVAFLQLVR